MGQTGREMGCCKHWEPVGQTHNQGSSGGKNEKVLDPELVEGGCEERGLFYERDWTRRALVS